MLLFTGRSVSMKNMVTGCVIEDMGESSDSLLRIRNRFLRNGTMLRHNTANHNANFYCHFVVCWMRSACGSYVGRPVRYTVQSGRL